MANLGLIDFKLGLYIKVNVNAGQNKFEVHISKNVTNGHNLAIFHLILTNEYTKMTISSRRIEWIKKLSSISLLENLVFGAHFCSKASMGNVVPMDSKLLSNYWYMSWPSWPTHISKLCSHKNQG